MMSLYWCKCAHMHTEIWPVNFLLNLNNQENDLMFLYDAKVCLFSSYFYAAAYGNQ